MLRNYFTTAIRYLSKNRVFTIINTLGLAVSISCSLLIYLYVKNDLTFDEFHRDIERLYIIGEGSREGSEKEAAYYQTVYPALPAMLETFPEIETGTRYFDWEAHMLLANDKRFMHQVHFVDSTFLNTLTFNLIEGDPQTALKNENSIVISRNIAEKLFGTTDIRGKAIELETGKQYLVTGVLDDIPYNSTVRPEVLIPLMDKEADSEFVSMANWYNTIAQVIIKCKPNADPDQLRAKFPAFIKQHYDPSAKGRTLKAYPLADLHHSVADNETYIYGLTTIGVFILLIAIINFMNLAIAGSLKRLRETGMRKVMGSDKGSIVFQFFLEALLLTVVSIVASLGLIQIALPILNEALGVQLHLTMDDALDAVLPLAGLAILIGLVAGGYPALYLSNYKTVSAVKGIIPNHQGKLTLRNSLVVVQFVVSVTLIIAVLVTSRQIYYMKTADLKFQRENVLIVNMDAGFVNEKSARSRVQGIVNELRGRADIVSVSQSQNVPGRYWENYNWFKKEGSDEGLSLRKAYVDDHYLPTYDIKVVEGRNFSSQFADSTNAIMLNAAAVKALGWTSAVGKTLRENGENRVYTVVGVFDDFHYRSLEGAVEPLVHFYFHQFNYTNFISLRLVPDRAPGVISFLKSEWQTLDSWTGFNYFFADEEFNAQYQGVERTLTLIGIFTMVAIVVSCAGIFALSAISAQQRTREIGIRKVLGASVANIVGLLSRDYIKLVIIAIVVATPLAAWGMARWLEEFAFKVDLSWWVFALAGVCAILIAIITTGFQSIRAAMHNPVDSLHND